MDDNYYYCINEKIPISEQEEYEFPPMNMRQKLAEWSEEDEEIIQNVLDFLEDPITAKMCPYLRKECQDWIKSLPERLDRPSWKPSDEQIKTLDIVISDYRHACTKGAIRKPKY